MPHPPLRILHTSDWHIGQNLHGRKRHEAFAAFLLWLEETVRREHVDLLLVAGDIFDTNTPSNRAQELYYQFLHRVTKTDCRHVVVIAGNHDSPTFLAAPQALLKALHVHVIAAITDNPEDEVLSLTREDGTPEAIVCAVPYLRDRDIRTVEAGESVEDKERKLVEGISRHYRSIGELASSRRDSLQASLSDQSRLPIIALGHLFTAGGTTVDGDGVRQLYVGSLAHVSADAFPDCIDYLALGHLHVPQKVGGCETRRYSGAPLPMGFDELEKEKSVCLVDLHDGTAQVRLLPVPVFQRLERVRGSWGAIASRLAELADSEAWLEVVYDGEDILDDLRGRVAQAVEGTRLDVLRIRNTRIMERTLSRETSESLDTLDAYDVFERCLNDHQVPEAQRPELRRTYQEAVTSLLEADPHAD